MHSVLVYCLHPPINDYKWVFDDTHPLSSTTIQKASHDELPKGCWNTHSWPHSPRPLHNPHYSNQIGTCFHSVTSHARYHRAEKGYPNAVCLPPVFQWLLLYVIPFLLIAAICICTEEPQDVSLPNGCSHLFCTSCLTESSHRVGFLALPHS